MTRQQPSSRNNDDPVRPILLALVIIFGVIMIGLWGLALFRSGAFASAASTPALTSLSNDLSCKNLIDKAMLLANDHCDKIGSNQVCYGNVTIKADLVPNSGKNFSNVGDLLDVMFLQKLSAAPLDLQKNEWGIAVFNIVANLPHTLPGETARMVVFGNTTIENGNTKKDIQSFYFSSVLGQITCDRVPFDGIMITMPNGAGVKLNINDTEMTLMGNASLKASKNGSMEVNLYSGSGSVTADGSTQFFGAGQQVSIPMGGVNGTGASGPPSQPTSLSASDLSVACSLTGTFCTPGAIDPVSAGNAQATVFAGVNGTPLPSTQAASSSPVPGVNPPSSGGNTGGSTGTNPGATNPPPAIQPTSPPPPPPTKGPAPTSKIPPGQLKKTPTPSP